MRIVIDKDFSEVKLLQEAYEKKMPTYKVKAVNQYDRFVYATDLKTINEAGNAVFDIGFDPVFDDCVAEIVESFEGKERVIWSSNSKTVVSESVVMNEKFWGKDGALANFFKGAADKAKKALDGIKSGWKNITEITKNFSKDLLNKWR